MDSRTHIPLTPATCCKITLFIPESLMESGINDGKSLWSCEKVGSVRIT